MIAQVIHVNKVYCLQDTKIYIWPISPLNIMQEMLIYWDGVMLEYHITVITWATGLGPYSISKHLQRIPIMFAYLLCWMMQLTLINESTKCKPHRLVQHAILSNTLFLAFVSWSRNGEEIYTDSHNWYWDNNPDPYLPLEGVEEQV